MKRCRSCRARAESASGICPVCGIDQDKSRKELTDREKQIWWTAHGIRGVAMLHLVGAGIGYDMLPQIQHPYVAVFLATINLLLAIGLIRYEYRAYQMAVTCYFAMVIVNVISVNLLAVPIFLLLLFLVGNKTAKALFERRLPEQQ